jgi:hypothetical protein
MSSAYFAFARQSATEKLMNAELRSSGKPRALRSPRQKPKRQDFEIALQKRGGQRYFLSNNVITASRTPVTALSSPVLSNNFSLLSNDFCG